jgi:hypothetical protein
MKIAKKNGDSVEYNKLNKQRTADIIERNLLNQAIIDAKKREKAAAAKAREAKRENIIAKSLLEGVSDNSCSPEMSGSSQNPECGSGVGVILCSPFDGGKDVKDKDFIINCIINSLYKL